MLYGIGLGPGDPELLTRKAIGLIEQADEVIVPGGVARDIIRGIREPRVSEFPMGGGKEAAERLSEELARRCLKEDIAFCCLGDVTLFSTFQELAEAVRARDSEVKIEMVPGITSVQAALSKLGVFIDAPMLITTGELKEPELYAIMKATRPTDVEWRLRERGFDEFYIAERVTMEGERVERIESFPSRSHYFTLLLAKRR
jgi:precorrin-2/cobalt-factor-2 C20-methyltransferase